MGFHASWTASRAPARKVLEGLRFSVKRQTEGEVVDPGLYGVALGDWYVVIGDGWDDMEKLDEEGTARLSRGAEALFFTTDDSSMATRLAGYRGGALVWAIDYDGSGGVGEPRVEGNAPVEVGPLLARLRDEQAKAGGPGAGVDHLYELTAEVGRALVGFRHDSTLGSGKVKPIDVLVGA